MYNRQEVGTIIVHLFFSFSKQPPLSKRVYCCFKDLCETYSIAKGKNIYVPHFFIQGHYKNLSLVKKNAAFSDVIVPLLLDWPFVTLYLRFYAFNVNAGCAIVTHRFFTLTDVFLCLTPSSSPHD